MNQRLIGKGIHFGDDAGGSTRTSSHTKLIDAGDQFAVQVKRRQP